MALHRKNKYFNHYLNVSRLSVPTKRHRLAEWIQKTHIYVVYKRSTSDLWTHTDR